MAIVTGKSNVLAVYREAEALGWALPCFNSENLTTTEAILAAAAAYGEAAGRPDVPITIGITVRYDHRPQAEYYTHTRLWDIGLRLFLADLQVLAGPGGPYEQLRVLIHLDHVLHGDDAELLNWDLSQFSSIMYDASRLPFEENIAQTAAFVNKYGSLLLVEGACDEIIDAGGNASNELTSADKAEHYYRTTGVDTIVVNLGTEHRASVSVLRYYGDYARRIKERIGSRLVLHGGSSVQGDSIATVADDGVCKVNVWTLLEREATPVLLEHLARNASRVAGGVTAKRLQAEGVLGIAAATEGEASLDYFATTARQQIVFEEMKRIVGEYLKLWYR